MAVVLPLPGTGEMAAASSGVVGELARMLITDLEVLHVFAIGTTHFNFRCFFLGRRRSGHHGQHWLPCSTLLLPALEKNLDGDLIKPAT